MISLYLVYFCFVLYLFQLKLTFFSRPPFEENCTIVFELNYILLERQKIFNHVSLMTFVLQQRRAAWHWIFCWLLSCCLTCRRTRNTLYFDCHFVFERGERCALMKNFWIGKELIALVKLRKVAAICAFLIAFCAESWHCRRFRYPNYSKLQIGRFPPFLQPVLHQSDIYMLQVKTVLKIQVKHIFQEKLSKAVNVRDYSSCVY